MFSVIGNGSELWKGEQGASRLEKLNSGFASATGLSSSSDMLAYRAAKRLNHGKPYYMVQEAMQEGLTPELYREYMKVLNETFGKDTGAKIEQFKKMGYSQRDSRILVEGGDKNLTDTQITAITNNRNKALPELNSTEFNFQKEVQMKANQVIIEGQKSYDEIAHAMIGSRIENDTLTAIRNDPNNSARTNENVAYEFAHIRDKYFRGEGDPLSDTTAFKQFCDMIRNATDSERQNILSNLNSRETSLNALVMDRHDMLNSILSDNTNASVFLDKLTQIVACLEEMKDAEEIIEIINK